MFKPYKVRDGEIEILGLLLHRLSAIDDSIIIALEQKDLRQLSSLREDLDEAIDELIHIVIASSGQEEQDEEEIDASDALRSRGPLGFAQPETTED